MPILDDLYSKRAKRERGELPDVFTYDKLSDKVRTQVDILLRKAFNTDHQSGAGSTALASIVEPLRLEYGRQSLSRGGTRVEELLGFFKGAPVDEALDVIELSLQRLERLNREFGISEQNRSAHIRLASDLADELNGRFLEEGIGYRFENGRIIRVDSTFVHAEAVKPVLLLLSDPDFKNADDEFRQAHEYHRKGKGEDVLTWCLKAFETTLKIICGKRGWQYEQTDRASKLISIVVSNGLVDGLHENQLQELKNLLQTTVAPLRNNRGGHGRGTEDYVVTESLAKLGLNLTASSMLFLIEEERSRPKT